MTIACRLCHYSMRSSKPDSQAQRDLLTTMGNHLGTAHHDEAVELAKLLAAVEHLSATYLLVKRYVDIPRNEKVLLDTFKQNENILMAALGFQETAETAEEEIPKSRVN